MRTIQKDYSALRRQYERLYIDLNRREFVSPDPLQFLYSYPDIKDREIAGLICATLAFGNVRQILRAVDSVLARIRRPREFVLSVNHVECKKIFKDFKYRFVSGNEISSLLIGLKRVLEEFGNIENCFAENMPSEANNALPGMENFIKLVLMNQKIKSHLLTLPSQGSACKRMNLYLRWMVRKDEVDPGGWSKISPSQLLIPLDTHMWKICTKEGFTKRKQANLKAVLEITEAFKKINPLDPVKYDFSLTRAGIRRNEAKVQR